MAGLLTNATSSDKGRHWTYEEGGAAFSVDGGDDSWAEQLLEREPVPSVTALAG
jgi:hypothetical protein